MDGNGRFQVNFIFDGKYPVLVVCCELDLQVQSIVFSGVSYHNIMIKLT